MVAARSFSSARYCWHRRRFPGFSHQSEFRCGLGDRIMTSYMSMAASRDRSLSLHRYFRLFRTTNDQEDLQQNRVYSLSEMENSIPNGNPSTRMFCPLHSVQSPRLSRTRGSEISTVSIPSPSATELTLTSRAFLPTLAIPATKRLTKNT